MNKDNINMAQPHPSGYLEIILGSMYSGKSTRLVEIYKQYKFCNISVIAINHIIDDRYDNDLLSTHDKVKIPCIKTEKLFDVLIDCIDFLGTDINKKSQPQEKFQLSTCDVILINEGQFFDDLYEFVLEMLKRNKKVYVCGLDGDFERKKFGSILDLIPLCDKVYKLTSLCSLCRDGTPGIFSMRLTNQKQQTVVGSDNYIPVCRKCYQKKCV
jgi:thymidine kinase